MKGLEVRVWGVHRATVPVKWLESSYHVSEMLSLSPSIQVAYGEHFFQGWRGV